MKQIKHQKGIALWIIFAIVGLMAVLGVTIANALRGSGASTTQDTQKVLATEVMNQVSNLKFGYDRMVTQGIASSTITADTTATTGLYDSASGYVAPQVTNAKIFTSGTSALWVYNKLLKVKGIGATATADYAMTLSGLTADVCAQINLMLTSATTIPTGAGATADWTGGTAIDMSAIAAVDQKPMLCVVDTDGKYAFYAVMKEN